MKRVMITVLLGVSGMMCRAMEDDGGEAARYTFAVSFCRPELRINRKVSYGTPEWDLAYQRAYELAASRRGADVDPFLLPKQYGSYELWIACARGERVLREWHFNPYERIAGLLFAKWSRNRG